MARERNEGPVAEFCAALRRLQQGCGLDVAALARQLRYSRSQLYAILDGQVRKPPEWDRLVEPLVRACTGDDRAVGVWRRRYDVLAEVYRELRRRDQADAKPKPQAVPTRVVPAQLPADVNAFTGRGVELAELDRLLASTIDQGTEANSGSTAVVISAVSGTAGWARLRWRCGGRIGSDMSSLTGSYTSTCAAMTLTSL